MQKRILLILFGIVFILTSNVWAKSPKKIDSLRVGWKLGKGIEFRAPQDYIVLQVGLRAQFLYTLDNKDSSLGNNLQIRRARLVFAGSLFGRHNRFRLQLAFSPKDMDWRLKTVRKIPLLDWHMDFTHLRDLQVRVGQARVPFARERLISSGRLAMIDRSIIDQEFQLDRDLGIVLYSKDLFGLKRIRYFAGISTGEGHQGLTSIDLGMMYSLRLEFVLAGQKIPTTQIDFSRSSKLRWSLGAAYSFIDKAKLTKGLTGSTYADGLTAQSHHMAADMLVVWSGWTLHSEFIVRKAAFNHDILGKTPRNGLGFFALLSYILPQVPLAFSVRYALIRSLGNVTQTGLKEKNSAGLAVGYYFVEHSLQLQADYFHFWGTSGFTKGSERVRIQLQASF